MKTSATFHKVDKVVHTSASTATCCSIVLLVAKKLNMFDLFDFVERTQNSFDFVAKNGNNVETTFDFVEVTFDFVERNVRFVPFRNFASTLLLVWTRLNSPKGCLKRRTNVRRMLINYVVFTACLQCLQYWSSLCGSPNTIVFWHQEGFHLKFPTPFISYEYRSSQSSHVAQY